MKAREKEQNDGIFRNSALIADRTKKMALTYIGSTICVAAVTLADSLIAGISIGPEALAAIAAAGPLLTIEQILHCILGFGIDKLMIREIGKGKRKEADRIFGTVLIAVAVVYVLIVVQKGLTIVSAAIGYSLDMKGFYAVYVLALYLAALVLLILLAHDRFWFVPERNPELIKAYSLQLKKEQIAALSDDAARELSGCLFPEDFCYRVSQVVEDSASYIAQMNGDSPVSADIQMRHQADHVQIMIIDDGEAYNPLTEIAEANWKQPGAVEAVSVLGLSAKVNFDRVLGLNNLSLDVNLPEQAGA